MSRESDYYDGTPSPAQASSGNVPTEEAREATPLGDNPYFPAESKAAPAVEEPTSGSAPTPAAQAEPMFDEATDAAAGINVDSPEYKHFQAAFTRNSQRAKSETEAELDRRMSALEQTTTPAKENKSNTGNTPAPTTYNVNWEDFSTPNLGDDRVLQGNEAEIMEIVKPMFDHVLSTVNAQVRQQEEAFTTQQQVAGTVNYLRGVSAELAKIDPAHAEKFSAMVTEHSKFARENPNEFANYAVMKLGIDPNAYNEDGTPRDTAPTPQDAVTPDHVRTPARPSPRTAPHARESAPVFTGKTSSERTEQAVAHAFDQMFKS